MVAAYIRRGVQPLVIVALLVPMVFYTAVKYAGEVDHVTGPDLLVVGGVHSSVHHADTPLKLDNAGRNISKYKIMYTMPQLNMYIYTAFLDDRFGRNTIRVFGLQKGVEQPAEFSCLWHSPEGAPQQVRAHWSLVDKDWPHWSLYFAFTFDCHVPRNLSHFDPVVLQSRDEKHRVEVAVEQAVAAAGSTDIAVCLKPVTGRLSVTRLLEWIETLRATGINDFVLYNSDMAGPSHFVKEYYESLGVLRTISFPFLNAVIDKVEKYEKDFDGYKRYAVFQQTYLIAIHDCLYRFHKRYKYLAYIDKDEVIIPTKNLSVSQAVEKAVLLYPDAAAVMFLTAWHWEESGVEGNSSIPDFLYMQKYARATPPIDNQPKSVVLTSRTISLNFHAILDVPDTRYRNAIAPAEQVGYIHHYRGKCADKFDPKTCKQMLADSRVDTEIVKVRHRVEAKVRNILDYLPTGFEEL